MILPSMEYYTQLAICILILGRKKFFTKYGVLHTVSYTYTNIGINGPSLVSDILCVEVDR